MRINFIEVRPDIEINLYGSRKPIREAIIEVGTDFMAHLKSGIPFVKNYEQEIQFSEAEQATALQLESRLGVLRAIAEHTENKISELQDEIQSFLASTGVGTESLKKTPFKYFGISQTDTFNTSSAVGVLKKHNVDVESLRSTRAPEEVKPRDLNTSEAIRMLSMHGLLDQCLKDPDFDENKVQDALRAVGENPDLFSDSSYKFRKQTNKNAKIEFEKLSQLTVGIEHYPEMKQLQTEQDPSSSLRLDAG